MNIIEIIDYLPEHQPYFEALNRAWIEKYFELEELDKYVLQQPEEAILKHGGAILMATFDGVIAGTVALKKMNEDEYELAKMAVDESYRRRGIAEKLCSAIVEKAKYLGAKKLILYSQTILEPALVLYRKLGFIQVALGKPAHKRSDVKMEIEFHPPYSFGAAHQKENSNNFI
ncbi:MAG: GNAT family N-acetyltransferase [Flavisolibacter sp.]